ncbi:MAG: hypothetical protein AAB091_02730, partial [Elusimicrobiota bacterium]
FSNGTATVTGICPRRARKSNDTLVSDAQLLAQDLDSSDPDLGLRYSNNFTVKPSGPSRLQVLTQDQTQAPGTPTGRVAGFPAAKTSGTAFSVRARITDLYWNLVESGSYDLRVKTSDPNDVEPSTKTVSVSDTFVLNLKRAATDHFIGIYAEPVSGDPATGPNLPEDSDTGPSDVQYYSRISSLTVNAGSANRIILLHPEQSLNQGATSYVTARTGNVPNRAAGTAFTVYVYLVDQNFNVVKGVRNGDLVTVTAPGDPLGSLGFSGTIDASQGFATVPNVTLRRSGSLRLEAVISPATLQGYNSDSQSAGTNPVPFNVTAGAPQGFQVLMPWETENSGQGEYPNGGKIVGSTSTAASPGIFAGVPFNVKVRAVDSFFNSVSNSVSGWNCPGADPCPSVYLDTSDPYDGAYDVQTGTKNLNSTGEITLSATLVSRRADHTIFARNVNGILANIDVNAANRTTAFFVESSAPAKLTALLPAEYEVEGKCDVAGICKSISGPPGKGGLPSSFAVGGSTQVRVQLVDAYYNRIRDVASQPYVRVETPWDNLDLSEIIPAQ